MLTRTNGRIRGVPAVHAGDIHHIVLAGKPRHHLHDARVGGFGQLLHFLQQRHFIGRRQRGNRIAACINLFAERGHRHAHGRVVARRANHFHRLRRLQHRIGRQAVGIGQSGFFARHRAHADTLVNLETARFHHAFVQMPAFIRRPLAINIRIIHVMRADERQRFGQFFGRKAVGVK